MYIYKTTNLINGKCYIGKSEKEFNENYLGSGVLLQKAIKKYGKSNFKVEKIKDCKTIEDLNENEKFYVDVYKNNSYNLAEGGTGGWTTKHFSEKDLIKYKKNLSNSQRGRIVNDNTRQKISMSNKGKFFGDKKTISDKIKEMWKDPNSIYNSTEYRENLSRAGKNRVWSEETKNKISNSRKGGDNPAAIKIKVGDEIFETRRECANRFGISETAVTKRCKSNNFKEWKLL